MLGFFLTGFALGKADLTRPVQVDMTYNCGDRVFLTAVNIRDPRFERIQSPAFAKKEPMIPVCFLISNGRKQDDYEYLAKNLAKAAGLKDADRVAFWISDGEKALVLGFQSTTPFQQPDSRHIRCELHLRSNVDAQLSKTLKDKEVRGSIIQEIFGSERQLAKGGRIREQGTMHVLSFLCMRSKLVDFFRIGRLLQSSRF